MRWLYQEFPAIEYRIVRPSDGELRWVAAWGHNFYDDHAHPKQQVGMIQDITERKLRDQQLQETTEQLQLVLEGGHLDFWDWNILTGEVQRNAIWSEILGYNHEDIQQTTQQWEDFIYVDDRPKAWQSIYDTLNGHTPYHEVEYRMRHKDGSIRWILDHASVVQRDSNGKPTRMSGTHTDISRLKQLQEQLYESERFFQSLAQVSPVSIYRTDAQGNCIYVNEQWCALSGFTAQQALGNGWYTAVMPEDRQKVVLAWREFIDKQQKFSLEYRYQQPNGKIVWLYGLAIAMRDETGGLMGYVGTEIDISERKATEEYINHLAFYDFLTQLPNRRLLHERIKHAIQHNRRTGEKMAALMMDLDRFKAVNDALGHAAGDELLQQVAQRITERLRAVDMVARLGGDEFVVLLENIGDTEQVASVAKAVIFTLSQPFTLNQSHEVSIGVSIGIAILPEHGDTVDALLDHADNALYHAKDRGRGCFAYFAE